MTTFKPGDAVFGPINATYAEYTVAAANELALKPAALSFDEAASVPVGALTAWGAVEAANIQPGQRVFVQGAAGGVGLFAAQLAKAKGALVSGTASAVNLDFVRSLGVEAIDYDAAPFETVVHDVDIVIDTVGGEVLQRSWDVLKPGGLLVSIAGRATEEEAQSRGKHFKGAGRAPASNLTAIAAMITAGQLTPAIQATFRSLMLPPPSSCAKPATVAGALSWISIEGRGRKAVKSGAADRAQHGQQRLILRRKD